MIDGNNVIILVIPNDDVIISIETFSIQILDEEEEEERMLPYNFYLD